MSQLERKLSDKTAIIGIVGLGYVGLPLAIAFAQVNFKVIGFDIQAERVKAVNQGESYITDVNSQTLAMLVASNRLRATTDQSYLTEVDVVCICVPTPLSKSKGPDLSYVIHESEEICKYLRPEKLIILESTTYPGTTEDIILPILERSGLKAGQDFYLAYSPERIDPGNREYNIKNTVKLVGSVDSKSTRLATLLYQQVADRIIPVSSSNVAEMAKIFENVFRNVNIALVNELALLCENMGISVWEVIEASSSKPFGYMPFYPGLGAGGHCIPIDPYYLSSKAKEYNFHTRFIELAVEINERMPEYVASRITEILNDSGKCIFGAKLLVLGVAFKKDVGDTRESPALRLIHLLRKKGAEVTYNDPYVAQVHLGTDTLTSTELNKDSLSTADCVIIATDHCDYDYQYIIDNANVVFDAKGVTRKISGNNIIRLGEQKVGDRQVPEVEETEVLKVKSPSLK